MLEEFRALVRSGVLRVTPDNEVVFVDPAEARGAVSAAYDDLDRQLGEWMQKAARRPATGPAPPEPPPAAPTFGGRLRQALIDRAAKKILDALDSGPELSRALQHDIVERVADLLIERWDREK